MRHHIRVRFEVWAGLLLLVAVLTFHRRVLFDSNFTFPWDFRSYHYPLAVAYADAVQAGDLPLWDPFTYCGRPLAANPQAAVFYPGMMAAVAFGRQGLLERMEWLAAGHIFLAALFTFFLARRIGLAGPAALCAAVAFGLGGFFASQVEHLGVILCAPWLVLSCWAVLLEPPRRVCWMAFAWTMSLLAGFPAFSVMTVLATALLVACLAPAWRAGRDLLLAGLLACAMAYVQLGPTFELVGQSVGKYRTDWMKGGGIVPEALITLLAPNYFGGFDLAHFHGRADPTQMYLFSGWTVLALAAIGLGRRTLRLAGFCVCCLLLMLGEYTPVGKGLFHLFPEVAQRATYFFVFMAPAMLALALLAGWGASRLRGWAWIAILAASAELIAIGSNRPMNSESEIVSPTPTAESFENSVEAAARLRAWTGDQRMDTTSTSVPMMSTAPVLRWRTAGGYDPLALEGVMSVRRQAVRGGGARWGANYPVELPDSPSLDWMSVRVVTSPQRLETQRLENLGEIRGLQVYMNPNALPRYRAENCEVKPRRELSNRVELDLDCAAGSLLETSEAQYSAWRVEVDGRPAEMQTIHNAFRGVRVPAGQHSVVFLYSTTVLVWSSLISLGGWFVWICVALRRSPSAQAATIAA